MRKLFLLFWALLATTTLWAHDFVVDGIYYNYLDGNNVAVTYKGSYSYSYDDEYSGEVTIPETVTHRGATYSITSIGDEAFRSCSSLTSITIPNSVTSIGDEAFYSCSSLTSITIPNSVTSIGYYAFNYCTSLTITNYTGDVASWCNIKFGYKANPICYSHNFYINGEEITELVIPDSVTSIGDYAFYDCDALTSVKIEATTPPSLGSNVFPTNLKTIYIPDNTVSAYQQVWGNEYSYVNNETILSLHVEVPGTLVDMVLDAGTRPMNVAKLTLTGSLNDADFTCMHETMTALIYLDLSGITNTYGVNFKGKSRLTTVILPNDLMSIADGAFDDCSSLTSIIIPNSVTSIGNLAFSDCSSLTSITISNSVTSIGYTAFSGCSSLTSVTIPNSVRSIGNVAFSDCSSLTSITIPNSVTYIGDGAFQDCSSLTSIIIPNSITSIGEAVFSSCDALTSVTIPNSVTSIGARAFSYCDALNSITIPESVTWIGSSAFKYSSLTSITCLGTTPPNASDLGAPTSNCTLTVPQSAYNDYLRHTYWGSFLNINTGYLVSLQANNDQWGEVTGAGLYAQDSTITITATPNEGYTFLRWSDGNTDNPRTLTTTQDTTLTAEFAIEGGCLVTFVDWDGTMLSSVSVAPGEAATAPADPTREGYTFIGWDKDFSAVTDHMTVTAQYQINRYRVRFFDDDTLLKTDSVEYHSAAIAPANPYHEGYTFIGWDQAFDSITSDLDVYAQYEMGEDRDMTIVFTNSEDNDNEILSQSITIKIPAAPEIAGFTFLYWQPVAEPITNVITIQAIYEADVPSSAPEVYVNPANPAQKLLRNGQVYILQDGQTYTIQGQKL